jgi:hypothetical protein
MNLQLIEPSHKLQRKENVVIYAQGTYGNKVKTKDVLIRLGIYLFASKARGVGGPKILFVLSDATTI